MPSIEYSHSPLSVEKLKSSARFDVLPDHENPGWYRLRSGALTNKQLFAMLQAAWPAVVGAEPHKFALIHCLGGPYAGVWFHLLPNGEYEPGCHEVATL